MKVLSLTHSHLDAEGLSPVSCERADSIVGIWGDVLGWEVDVVHTKDTKWRGQWPGGKGLKVRVLVEQAPEELMNTTAELFTEAIKRLIGQKKFFQVLDLLQSRLFKRIRFMLVSNGYMWPDLLRKAQRWGQLLASSKQIGSRKYDFLFVCVGYGDEYLLQTGLTLSQKLGLPMVVDFRDLWSDHHKEGRFTEKQKKIIRGYERELMATTVLASVPQNHMVPLLKNWYPGPVLLVTHSAYVEPTWQDGAVVTDEFRMLYAGKLYPGSIGLHMLLELIQLLAKVKFDKPFKCHFFVDETDTLLLEAERYGVSDYIVANGWITPSELWKNIRSAHILALPDYGVSVDHPIVPTKTFQYALSGQKILCLLKYPNEDMEKFLKEHDAGVVYLNVDDAAKWVIEKAADPNLYLSLPPLKNVPQREGMATMLGSEIAKVLTKNR